MPRRVVALILMSLVPLTVFAESVESRGMSVPSLRDAALGGEHVAFADGFETLFSNPAGLVHVDPQFSFIPLTVRLAGPVFSLSSAIAQGIGGDLATVLASPSVQDLLRSIYANLSLTGPLYFGYAGSGKGFAVLNESDALFQNVGTAGFEARLSQRLLVVAGYGLVIPLPDSWESSLSAGLGLKGFVRGDVIVRTSLLELPALVDSAGFDLLTSSPFELISGIGIDAGLSYQWRGTIGVAVTAENLYASSATLSYDQLGEFLDSSGDAGLPAYSTPAREVTLGFAYTPSLGAFERYVQNLIVLIDYRDIFDFWMDPANTENIILKLGLGVEATLLEVLALRVGLGDGLFAAGLALNLASVTLSAAMHGSELSAEPGLRPVYNLVLGLEFRR